MLNMAKTRELAAERVESIVEYRKGEDSFCSENGY